MLEARAVYLDSSGLRSTPWSMGTCCMCSTPPITNTSPLSVMIAWAALCRACMEEPHRRLTVCAALVRGRPASMEMLRAMFIACSLVWFTQPQITSSVSSMFQLGLRSISAWISSADSFSARTLRNWPLRVLPIGVRTASTMTTSFGFKLISKSPLPVPYAKKASPLAALSLSIWGAS